MINKSMVTSKQISGVGNSIPLRHLFIFKNDPCGSAILGRAHAPFQPDNRNSNGSSISQPGRHVETPFRSKQVRDGAAAESKTFFRSG
jgi:hypothetical protein